MIENFSLPQQAASAFDKLRRHPLLGPGIISLVIKVAGAGLSYVMLVAFAHLLSPAEYGVFAFSFNLSIVVAAFFGFGYATAITRLVWLRRVISAWVTTSQVSKFGQKGGPWTAANSPGTKEEGGWSLTRREHSTACTYTCQALLCGDFCHICRAGAGTNRAATRSGPSRTTGRLPGARSRVRRCRQRGRRTPHRQPSYWVGRPWSGPGRARSIARAAETAAR